jgi:hypothetical protein
VIRDGGELSYTKEREGYDSKKFILNLEYGGNKLLRNVEKYLPIGATSLSERLQSPECLSGIQHAATGN